MNISHASPALAKEALRGAAAGLFGGVVLGAAMLGTGMPGAAGPFARGHPAAGAELVQWMLALTGGAGFSVVVWRQRFGAGEMLFWGMAYGILKWFAVSLTVMPLLMQHAVAWSREATQAAIPTLFGYLLSGASTALALTALRPRGLAYAGRFGGIAVRGAAAGLTAMWLLDRVLKAQDRSLEFMATSGAGDLPAGLGVLIAGALAGASFALLYPAPGGSGPGLVRGTMFGFFWWLVAGLTVLPMLAGDGPAWSLVAVRARFVTLPGYVLAGAAIALVDHWLAMLIPFLFSDEIGSREGEGLGGRGVRLTGRGALAGLVGGLLFAIVMVRMNELPAVARLVGSASPWTGFTVHLAIAEMVGASYGLLFARQSYDVGSGLGWGLSYGFFWWILGPLTLAPMLLGAAPRWTAAAAGALLPSLVGHLLYGAGLGIVFHLLEARYSPWWVPRTELEASAAARRKEQLLTSAPALWALVVVIALTLPILLG